MLYVRTGGVGKQSWGLKRKWNGPDCLRCSSTTDKEERFCWFCGWDMSKKANLCDRCGIVTEEGRKCEICHPDLTAKWEDWEKAAEDDD